MTDSADPSTTNPVDLDALAGASVRLRELHEADLASLCAWWADPRIVPFQVAGPPHLRPSDGVREMFRTWSANDGLDCGFSIVAKDSGELLGHGALFQTQPKDRCATLGIFLGPDHHGQGFGTDAVRVLVRYGFAQLGLHRIQLEVFAFNQPAIASYRKVGFVEEGRRRSAVYRNGAWHDEVLMGMLRTEWPGQGMS
ncbi:GNAT family N-acetyltransferase [Actinopolymorpha rutila]|uniref:RimJ/RimL family protein N-acetyltransferase n=1 Tax=Actinopolymorpha rutila TaxID=446787 RepID=A0A852ZDF8_9ACTN|nr:GNAT family protein [Actinopolymorpha rutila]NYH87729.1 RimJ/RimL family protein N-acetyltransferase [Actinopolymorpha rutila]